MGPTRVWAILCSKLVDGRCRIKFPVALVDLVVRSKKKSKNVCNKFFIQIWWSYVYFFKNYKCITGKRRDEKQANKMKNKVMIQLLEACVSLFTRNASLVPFQFSFLSKKHSYFTFLQKQILKKDFIIIRLQINPKATVNWSKRMKSLRKRIISNFFLILKI